MEITDSNRALVNKIAWAAVLCAVISLVILQWTAVPDPQRTVLDIVLILAVLSLGATIVFSPHLARSQDWAILAIALTAIAVVATFDVFLAGVDLSPVFVIVVVLCAITSRMGTTLAAAIAAGLTQALVVAGSNIDPSTTALQVAVHTVVYLTAGYLVSHVASGITERWSAQAAESEIERINIARQRDELEGLFEISQAFASLEDERETLHRVTERIAHLLGADICAISRIEGAGIVRAVPPAFGLEDDAVASFEYTVTPELTGVWDLGKDESVILNDLTQLPLGIHKIIAPMNICHAIAARTMFQNHPTGMIFAANRAGGRAFDQKDARLLGILAGQAGVALENARLYATARENLQNVTRLYAISSQLVARSDPDSIPNKIVNAVAEALNAPIASMALLNEETGKLEYAANLGVPEQALKVEFREHGVAMGVVQSGQARYFEDIQLADDVNPITRDWGFRATACLPICHRDKPLGVLYVNYSEPHSFTSVDKTMLGIFANQAAVALENARLHRVEYRRAKELEALSNISRALAETMNLGEMYHAIEREIRIAHPKADAGALLILDPISGNLVPRASFGFDRETLNQMELAPGEGIAGQAFLDSRSVHLNGVRTADEIRRSMKPRNQALLAAASSKQVYAQSIICVPVPPAGEKLGAIILLNYQSGGAFQRHDLRLLEGIADRIALAIRNAQFYEQGVRRAAQLVTVAEVAHSVSAILDMNTLLPTVVQRIHDQFGYRYVHVYMNDNSSRTTVFRAGAGPAAEAMREERVTVSFGTGIIGWVAETGQILLANDVRNETRFVQYPLLPETRAEFTLPLKAGTHMIGVLDVQSERPNVFESTDIAALETLAGQIATAIENATLYGDLQEQARRDSLTQVYNHGYFMQRLSEEVECAAAKSESLSLIMLDIDYFKEYNDQYGHVIGDQVLGAIVQAISSHVHRTDVIGRWGGEEFGIALLRATPQDALSVANRVRQTLLTTRLFDKTGDEIIPPTVSQGVATFPRDACDTASLIDKADAALYRAKSRGRDQICTSDK